MDRAWPWLPKQWMLPQVLQDFHLPEMKDSLMLGLQEEKDKMEVTLDTSGYKPDELKVEIKDGELCVEGKHEERSQTGEVMVSRQFSRRFGMPQNVKKEGIISNLSQDGVMVITMPKEQRIEEVEGKHEEKSEAGAVMVSRQFVKEYALPESSKPEGVESSLSKDGVLVITMPKPKKAINQDKSRSVPIAIK